MDYRECCRMGQEMLEGAGIREGALEARLLLEHVCGTDHNTLLAHGDRPVSPREEKLYLQALEKRRERRPLQHITGRQEFMGLSFEVGEDVLIPRQDTEILVEEVLRQLQDGMRVLDLCTGSGCILISLLHYNNWCEGVGTDLSQRALEVAERNAGRLLEPDKKWSFLQGDLFAPVEGKFDFIVANPPYIKTRELEELMPEVRDYEPRLALDGGEDGLDFYRRIIGESGEYLMSGGRLYFEVGWDQGDAVRTLMEKAGYQEVEVVRDYAGLDRVVCGICLPGRKGVFENV